MQDDVQFGADSIVIGQKELLFTGGGFLHRHNFIPGNSSCLADADNRLGDTRMPVTVDHQPGVTGQNCERVERVCELDGDPAAPISHAMCRCKSSASLSSATAGNAALMAIEILSRPAHDAQPP